MNKRYVRNLQFVGAIIDHVYGIIVRNEILSFGPQPMHFDPNSSRVALHPSFLLQLSCPDEDLDLYSAPDKSSIIFRDPRAIKELVVALLSPLLKKFRTCESLAQSATALDRFLRTMQVPLALLLPPDALYAIGDDIDLKAKRKSLRMESIFEDGEDWELHRIRQDSAFESSFFSTSPDPRASLCSTSSTPVMIPAEKKRKQEGFNSQRYTSHHMHTRAKQRKNVEGLPELEGHPTHSSSCQQQVIGLSSDFVPLLYCEQRQQQQQTPPQSTPHSSLLGNDVLEKERASNQMLNADFTISYTSEPTKSMTSSQKPSLSFDSWAPAGIRCRFMLLPITSLF